MSKAAITKRLDGYWKMEAANVLLVPLGMLGLATFFDWQLGYASLFSFLPVCLLLAIGAQYWRAKLMQLNSGSALPQGIGLLARLQVPALVATILAGTYVALAWVMQGLSASLSDRWVATAMMVLAVLEYVNYYHRQVQHFDHSADFKRLMSGRGFRRSQMAIDLQRWRAQS